MSNLLFQAWGAGAGLGIRRALVLVASQKTLTVAVPVLAGLASTSAGVLRPELVGIAVLPCIFVHLLQTVIDFVLVAKWRRSDKQNVP